MRSADTKALMEIAHLIEQVCVLVAIKQEGIVRVARLMTSIRDAWFNSLPYKTQLIGGLLFMVFVVVTTFILMLIIYKKGDKNVRRF